MLEFFVGLIVLIMAGAYFKLTGYVINKLLKKYSDEWNETGEFDGVECSLLSVAIHALLVLVGMFIYLIGSLILLLCN